MGSPTSLVLRSAPTPCRPRTRLVCSRAGSRMVPLVRSSSRCGTTAARPGVDLGDPDAVVSMQRRPGLPGSWGAPCAHAVVSDPVGVVAPGPCGATMLPSASVTASASATNALSGLNTRPTHSLSTLRSRGCAPGPRKTRFRSAGQPYRAGLITRWAPIEGFNLWFPPSPGFAWRTTDRHWA